MLKEIEKLQSALAFSLQAKPDQTGGAQRLVSGEGNTIKQDNVTVQQTPQPRVSLQWSREFKISGQIGEPGQKDKLTFSSLAHQMSKA